MKKNRWLHPTFTAVGLITVMIGFPGCTFLDSPADRASLVPPTSTQHVSYHQSSNQLGPREANDQNNLGIAQPKEDTSLKRDPDPGWGPVSLFDGIRW